MGEDGAPPGTFEEALAVAFGERASEFSDELKANLHTLYRRGRLDGRRANFQVAAEARFHMEHAMAAARAETEQERQRALDVMHHAFVEREDY